MSARPAKIGIAAAGVVVAALLAGLTLQAQETRPYERRAQAAAVTPGQVLAADQVRFVENPGVYGLGSELRGSRYAIVDGYLIRIDPRSLEVQSVIRSKVRPAD